MGAESKEVGGCFPSFLRKGVRRSHTCVTTSTTTTTIFTISH